MYIYCNHLKIYWLAKFFRHTRTCIHTPGSPPMVPDDLSRSSLLSALDGAKIVYSDIRLHETALLVAQEVKISLISLMLQVFTPCVVLTPLSRFFRKQSSLFTFQVESLKENQYFSSFSFWVVISLSLFKHQWTGCWSML